ncbi:MAG: hypothetical protein OEY96_04415 [Gammaproteobacteria bacterium]|nr:hypothetical protein [Gammaproteobacteria bacterium]
MKPFIHSLILLIAVHFPHSFASDKDKESKFNDIVDEMQNQTFSDEEIKAIQGLIDNVLTWTVEENEKGYMMYIDFPYLDIQKPVDYLSLTLVKFKGEKQPIIFSIVCSSIIDASKGISISFGKRIADSQKIEMSKNSLKNIAFTESNEEFHKISFEQMKMGDISLLVEFMNNDHLFVDLESNKGEKFEIAFPLFKFKEQYKNLK